MEIHTFEKGLIIWMIILLTLTFTTFLIKFLTIKNEIKKAGINYFIAEPEKTMKKNTAIVLMVVFVIILLYLIISSIIFSLWIFLLFPILFIMNAIIMFNIEQKYKNINGIYENGIIHYYKELFEWEKIHSYSITEKNLSGYFKNGNIFEYKNIENIDEIQYLFEKNKIKHRG